jgi:hypothetical protein
MVTLINASLRQIIAPPNWRCEREIVHTTAVVPQLCYNIGSVIDRGGQVDILYLDFSKAFDSVSHRLSVHKLKSYGIQGKLLGWFQQYLSGRQQRVVLEGVTSDWLPVTSGVPQGSILGPLLFLLYINDMSSVIQSSTLALFTDDAKRFKSISCQEDVNELQADMDRLVTWSDTWKMKFNSSKCKVMSVTRRDNRIFYNYSMNNSILDHVGGVFKDLGVLLSTPHSRGVRTYKTVSAKLNVYVV